MPPGSAPGSGTTGLEAVPVGADRREGRGGGGETFEIKQYLEEYKDKVPACHFNFTLFHFHSYFIKSCRIAEMIMSFKRDLRTKKSLKRHITQFSTTSQLPNSQIHYSYITHSVIG